MRIRRSQESRHPASCFAAKKRGEEPCRAAIRAEFCLRAYCRAHSRSSDLHPRRDCRGSCWTMICVQLSSEAPIQTQAERHVCATHANATNIDAVVRSRRSRKKTIRFRPLRAQGANGVGAE